MSFDREAQLSRRIGSGLLHEIRQNQLPAYTSLPCEDPEALVMVLGYLGVEEARRHACWYRPGWNAWDAMIRSRSISLEGWASQLELFLGKLPPHSVVLDCLRCGGVGAIKRPEFEPKVEENPCSRCEGARRLPFESPADQWLVMAGMVAVGRARWELRAASCDVRPKRDCKTSCPRCTWLWEALEASEGLLEEPTATEGFRVAQLYGDPDGWGDWLPYFGDRYESLLGAAEDLGEAKVREVLSAEIARRILGLREDHQALSKSSG